MTDLKSADTHALLPPNFRHDPDIRAFCYAIDRMDALFFARLAGTVVWSAMAEMPENMTAYMASGLRTPFYDSSLPLETRRRMVMETLEWYAHLGTKEVIEDIVRMVYGSGDITEWFEFGGEPGVFRISTLARLGSREEFESFIELLWRVKNTRSHLERLIYRRRSETKIYFGAVLRQKRKFRIAGEARRK